MSRGTRISRTNRSRYQGFEPNPIMVASKWTPNWSSPMGIALPPYAYPRFVTQPERNGSYADVVSPNLGLGDNSWTIVPVHGSDQSIASRYHAFVSKPGRPLTSHPFIQYHDDTAVKWQPHDLGLPRSTQARPKPVRKRQTHNKCCKSNASHTGVMLLGKPIESYSISDFHDCIENILAGCASKIVNHKHARGLVPDKTKRSKLIDLLKEAILARICQRVSSNKERRIAYCHMARRPVVQTVTPDLDKDEDDILDELINSGFARPPTEPRHLQTPVLEQPHATDPDTDVTAIKRIQEQQARQLDALMQMMQDFSPTRVGMAATATRASVTPRTIDFEDITEHQSPANKPHQHKLKEDSDSDDADDSSDDESSASGSSSSSSDIDPMPTFTTKSSSNCDMTELIGSYMTAIKYRSKYKKAKKKKKVRRTDVIFRYLMKSADSYRITPLNYHPVPPKRRRIFHDFIDNLKLVLSTVRETKNILADVMTPQEPSSASANKALFRLLTAFSDRHTMNQLMDLQVRTGKEDGYKALILLQELFATKDDASHKKRVHTAFITATLLPMETVFAFNKRFTYLYRNVTGSGQTIPEHERVQLYLDALKEHQDSRILYEVKMIAHEVTNGTNTRTLSEIQASLVAEEDTITTASRQKKPPNTANAATSDRKRRTSTDKRSRRTANATSATPHNNNKRKPPLKCYACGDTTHILKNCPTTSEADKKSIYALQRQKLPASYPKPSVAPKHAATAHSSHDKTNHDKTHTTGTNDSRASTAALAVAARRVGFAAPACRIATSCPAATNDSHSHNMPEEARIEDPLDITPPVIGTNDVVTNDNATLVIYEDQVLIDSGASDSMVHSFAYLDYITTCFATILLADGAMHNSDFQGLMRISVQDLNTGKRMVIPVMNTLLVPGIATVLWAVSGLAEQGHEVIFGFSTVSIRMHAHTDHSFTIGLRHPLLSHNGVVAPPFPFAGMSVNRTPSLNDDVSRTTASASQPPTEDSPLSLISLEKLRFDDKPVVVRPVTITPDAKRILPPVPSIHALMHRPPRPTAEGYQFMEDEHQRSLRDANNKLIYEQRFAQYMVHLRHFQQRHGLLDKEIPVYNPLDYPYLQHTIRFCPLPPALPPADAAPQAHAAYATLKDIYDAAHSYYQDWFKSDAKRTGEIEMQLWRARHGNPAPGLAATATVDKPRSPSYVKVPLDRLHARLAHRSPNAIILAQQYDLYSDVKVVPTPDDFCEICQISKIRWEDRGKPKSIQPLVAPGQIMYLDSQPNPVHGGLTAPTSFKNYLTICDQASRTFRAVGMTTSTTTGVIAAMDTFVFHNAPFPGFNLKDHCFELHVDAGSNLISAEFERWCKERDIRLIVAAPNHQEMNGINERNWQTARQMAFSMCNGARLGFPYFHHALQYACRIMDVLPAKGCRRFSGNAYQPSTPAIIWNQLRYGARLRKYRVFGCPVVFKVHQRKTPKDRVDSDKPQAHLTSKNIIQRGVRGIFIGFPPNQAGWLIFVPQSGNIIVSADVAFDEDFISAGLCYNRLLFHDAMTTRGTESYLDPTRDFSHTGPPIGLRHSSWPSPEDDLSEPSAPTHFVDDFAYVDQFDATKPPAVIHPPPATLAEYEVETILDTRSAPNGGTEYLVKWLDYPQPTWEPESHLNASALLEAAQLAQTQGGDDDETHQPSIQGGTDQSPSNPVVFQSSLNPPTPSIPDAPSQPTDSTAHLRRSKRTRRKAFSAFSLLAADAIEPPVKRHRFALAAELTGSDDLEIDAPGNDPAPFLNAPRDITQVYRMPKSIRDAWVRCFVKEIVGIIITRGTVVIEDPLPEDTTIPIMTVFKSKLNIDGMIDKLKCRAVFRGDLYDPADPQDPWNPHASFLSLKVFLALCAMHGMKMWQIDFVLAYLQAQMRERVFVKFPESWKPFLPEHIHKFIGRPVLLKKALYGYNYSGKFLYQDQAEFLESQHMQQSGLPGFWFRRDKDGSLLLFLHYSDDILLAGTNDRHVNGFLNKMKDRFDIEVKPTADWYLQTRISQDSDGNIKLDQSRYAKSMVSRFLPNVTEEPTADEKQKYAAPAKPLTRFTKQDSSQSKEEVKDLELEYGFRFIELVGCFNWLSYTCYEEIFAIRKLCKFMSMPGRIHFQAALHLLHHFRCHPPKPLIYYRDVSKSPLARLTKEIKDFDGELTYVVFADSAHADCDEGRSTCCDLQVFQGGIIDHISWVPNPVPLSTAESESNCYSAAIARSRFPFKAICNILYGNPNYDYTIPIFVDSSAAIAMNTTDKPTKRTRHIESRYWYGKQQCAQGRAKLYKVDGATQQAADIGTKIIQAHESRYYRYLFEGEHF